MLYSKEIFGSMKDGWIDVATSEAIHGWFSPGDVALLDVGGRVFEIRNGCHRPDLKEFQINENSGFCLSRDNSLEIFDFIDSFDEAPLVKLIDFKTNTVLNPKAGLRLTHKPSIFRPSPDVGLAEVAKILGLSVEDLKVLITSFRENGYLILPDFYSVGEMNVYSDYIDHLWEKRKHVQASVDIIDPDSSQQCILFEDADISQKTKPYKLNDLFLADEVTRSLSLSRKLSSLLSCITGSIVAQCNSLNFEYGSQQPYHFDTFYMPPPPGSQLIVSSLCIEDVTEEAGPLSYWPQSHKVTPWLNSQGTTHCFTSDDHKSAVKHFSEIARCEKLSPQTFLGKAGDLFIWHQQLFHGGLPIKDKSKTRKSLVSHYHCYAAQDLPDSFVAVNSYSGYLSRMPKGF